MNYKLELGISPSEAIEKIRQGQLAELHTQYDTLAKELARSADEERSCYYNYREPAKMFSPNVNSRGMFFPTYKKKPRRAKPDHSNPSWVEDEYRIMYKEPWYKGGNTKPRVPGWCDRILYYSLRDLDMLLTPMKLDESGRNHVSGAAECGEGAVDNYQAVNDVLRCSDHSPIHATFNLRTAKAPDGAPNQMYNIRLFDVRICDETCEHLLSRHGGWQSPEEVERDQTVDTGSLADSSDGRMVHVMAPAPFELEGKVYEEKHLQMDQMLPDRPGQVFSFCGFNQANVKPGTAHHMCLKFELCDFDSDSELETGECAVRLPLTDFVSSNTLHFRELLISGGVPVTDTRLFDGTRTKVYAVSYHLCSFLHCTDGLSLEMWWLPLQRLLICFSIAGF